MTDHSTPTGVSEAEIRELVTRVLGNVSTPDQPHAANLPHAEPAGDAATRTVAIGADHGGYPLKERIGFKLREQGYDVNDCGTNGPESVNYPEFAHAVARLVADGECDVGIIVDGAGIGSAMVANKVPGVRAALCYDLSSARNSREHNHSNVLTLGAGLIGDGLAWQIVQEWLATEWGTDRHARRVAMITEIEARYAGEGVRA